jgi:hypothetical protein
MEAAGLRVEATVRSEPKISVLNGPRLLGHGTVAQNPVCGKGGRSRHRAAAPSFGPLAVRGARAGAAFRLRAASRPARTR